MDKYYYDDVLDALFMFKNHGFQFEWLSPMTRQMMPWDNMTDGSTGYIVTHLDGAARAVLKFTEGKRIYLTPETVKLLDRHQSDLCFALDSEINMAYPGVVLGFNAGQIVQRNGKAFVWPKIEEAA